MTIARPKWGVMEVETKKVRERATKIQAYAEALDFFIENPKAITDPTLRLFVDFFNEKIAQEQERPTKGMGVQKPLIMA